MSEVTAINLEILQILGEGDSMTPSQIIARLPGYDKKDVKYSIRRLREKGLIRVIPNLMDMRRVFYRLSEPNEVKEEGARIKPVEMKLYQEVSTNAITPNTTLEDMEAAAHI